MAPSQRKQLIESACNGNIALLAQLQSVGVDVNITLSSTKCTLLHLAAGRGHVAYVRALVQNRLFKLAAASDAHGQSALHYAAFGGSTTVVTVLLQLQIFDINKTDHKGRTAVFLATAKSCMDVRTCLVRAGASDVASWDPTASMLDFSTYWVPDTCAAVCMCCQTNRFSFRQRRHHCRYCGSVICKACSVMVHGLARSHEKQRACKNCARQWHSQPEGIYASQGPISHAEQLSGADGTQPSKQTLEGALRGCPFFFATMTRAEAENLLRRDEHVDRYDFVLRSSSQEGHVALSVNHGPAIRHYLLLFSRGQWALITSGRPGKFFPLIDELVAHYRDGSPEKMRLRNAVTQARAAVIRAARIAAEAERQNQGQRPRLRPLFRCAQCEHGMEEGAVFCSHCGAHNPDGGVKEASGDNEAGGQGGDKVRIEERLAACPPTREPVMATMDDIVRHFSLTRAEAERLLSLRATEPGTFLVRNSSLANSVVVSIREDSRVKHFRIVLHDGQELANSNALIETTADLLDERITRQLVATVHNRQQDTRVWATELLQPCPMSEDLAFTCNCGEISTADLACCPKCGCTTVLERDPPDEWELDRASVQLGEALGAGNFGDVVHAHLDNGLNAAAKTLKDSEHHTPEFMKEMRMLKLVTGSDFVTNLLGVVTLGDPMVLIMEVVANGDLQSYLHDDRSWAPVNMPVHVTERITARYGADFLSIPPAQRSHFRFLNLALDICRGMEHVHSKGIVHLDLAARNVLVTGNERAKVCDFGHALLAADIDQHTWKPEKVAMRWSAPETMTGGRASFASDVWSFGVVLSELFTRGTAPYADIYDNKELTRKIRSGWRMPRPPLVPLEIYELMLAAWHAEGGQRPAFADMRQKTLDPLVSAGPGIVLTMS